MEFEKGSAVIVWNRKDGGLFETSGWHAGLFDLLEKFGIKSSPIREYVMWTTSVPGTYSISYTVNGNTMVINSVATQFQNVHGIDIKIPQEPKPPKKFGSPDKNTRREWRNSNQKHSRNTGRKIGLR